MQQLQLFKAVYVVSENEEEPQCVLEIDHQWVLMFFWQSWSNFCTSIFRLARPRLPVGDWIRAHVYQALTVCWSKIHWPLLLLLLYLHVCRYGRRLSLSEVLLFTDVGDKTSPKKKWVDEKKNTSGVISLTVYYYVWHIKQRIQTQDHLATWKKNLHAHISI